MRATPDRSLTLEQVAQITGGRVEGDASHTVARPAPLAEAGPDDLGFLADRRYLDQAAASGAGALLVAEDLAEAVAGDRPLVVVDDARRALQTLLSTLHPPRSPDPGVHPTAVLATGVVLGEGVEVGPYAVLEEGCRIGEGVRVGAHAVVGAGSEVGVHSVLHPHVVLYPGTIVGERVILHAGVRLGVDGFGYVQVDGAHRKVPQVGRCVVGDDVEIGANTTVDRGSIGDTSVGAGTKLDNLVHLAHNVHLGPHCAAAAFVGIAGSTRLGAGVFLGGQAGVIDHLELGDGVRLAAGSVVFRDVPAGETMSGHPARPHRESLRARAAMGRLPQLRDRVKALEERLAALEAASPARPEGPADD